MRLKSFFIIFALILGSAFSKPSKEALFEINRLLEGIGGQEGIIFIRNDSEFSGKQAAEHLRMKLDRAGDKVVSCEDFIKVCASRSSASGKPYLVKDRTGKVEDAEVFFLRELKQVRAREELSAPH